MAFADTGAIHFPAVFSPEEMAVLGDGLDAVLLGKPGKRLTTGSWMEALPLLTRIAGGLIGAGAFPVRAVAFDKTPETNWSVAWHQDRTIAVQARRDVGGFGPWSIKAGLLHVMPPMSVLAEMVTLRLHLDDCAEDNAPLKMAQGTHRLGRVAADQAAQVAESYPLILGVARAGDVWACSTPILHASERSRSGGRRRVLQVDYAAQALPGGLEWAGIGDRVVRNPGR